MVEIEVLKSVLFVQRTEIFNRLLLHHWFPDGEVLVRNRKGTRASPWSFVWGRREATLQFDGELQHMEEMLWPQAAAGSSPPTFSIMLFVEKVTCLLTQGWKMQLLLTEGWTMQLLLTQGWRMQPEPHIDGYEIATLLPPLTFNGYFNGCAQGVINRRHQEARLVATHASCNA
jgi:hypothetical protein